MKKKTFQTEFQAFKDIQVSAFAFELLREVLIEDVLGKDSSFLYWTGKGLARRYPLNSFDEIISFFHTSGWGTLIIAEKKKNEMEFELEGNLVSHRLKMQKEPSFQLEAGFIAEQLQQIDQHITESYEQIKRRSNKVIFTVKWDTKDPFINNGLKSIVRA